jgi:hypothetical protein
MTAEQLRIGLRTVGSSNADKVSTSVFPVRTTNGQTLLRTC